MRSFFIFMFGAVVLTQLMGIALLAAEDHSPKNIALHPCFIPNQGQLKTDPLLKNVVAYYTKNSSTSVFFRTNGFSYLIPASNRHHFDARHAQTVQPTSALEVLRVDIDFVGANTAVQIHPSQQQSQTTQFYHSTLHAPVLNVPSFGLIRYENLYEGIDLLFRFTDGELKYEFIVAPGADPSKIVMHVVNSTGLEVGNDNELRIHTEVGEIIDRDPIAFQEANGKARDSVALAFRISGSNVFGFYLPESYDRQKELIIDPAITWSTFFGGTSFDDVLDVALMSSGSLVVCGSSYSDVFPGVMPGRYNVGDLDFFVSKFNTDRTLSSTTYYGGPNADLATGIAVDKTDNVFICGYSQSPDLGFVRNVQQWSLVGEEDAVIIKFNSALLFQTGSFLGGNKKDQALDIAVDLDGNPVIVGSTASNNFPATVLYQSKPGPANDADAFIARWSNNLALLWSTYYGGRYSENALAVGTDVNRTIYVAGWTQSDNFPGLDGFQTKNRGLSDAFLLSFSSSGAVIHGTLIGGPGDEQVYAIDIAHGRIALTGFSSNDNAFSSFGHYQSQPLHRGLSDGFVLVTDLNLNGKWSTYWGGSGIEVLYSVRFASDSTLVVAGQTTGFDVPLKRSIQPPRADNVNDVFLAKFSFEGDVMWSTVLGGSDDDACNNVCIDAEGNMYLVGHTSSVDFPLRNAIFNANKGQTDGFVLKMCPSTPIIDFNQSDTVLCDGNSAILSADASMTRWKWSTGETTRTINAISSRKYCYSADSPRYGCNAFSDTISIRFKAKDAAVIRARGNTTLCLGDSVLVYSRDTFQAYSWHDAVGTEVGTSDSLYVKTAGSYYLKVIDAKRCTDSSSAIVVSAAQRPSLKYTALIDGVTLIDSCKSSLILCEGQSVVLEAANGIGTFVYWSNGASGKTLTIDKTQTLTAFVTDKSNCIWKMNDLNFQFIPKTILKVRGIDTTCAGTIVDLHAEPDIPGASYRWSISGATILTRADTSSIQLTWTSSGAKNISVSVVSGADCIEQGNFVVTISTKAPGRIQSPSGLALCAGASLTCKAPSGFANYYWNEQKGDSVLIVTKPGRYTVRFDNGGGCIGFDTVNVVQPLDYNIDSQPIEFDTLKVDASRQRSFRIINNGLAPMNVSALLKSGLPFRVDSTRPTSLTSIAIGDTARVFITFTPRTEQEFTDTVGVYIQLPCPDTISITLHGVGKGLPPAKLIRLAVDDQMVDVLQKTAIIPVQAWIESGGEGLSLDSLSFNIDYNPSLFRFVSTPSYTVRSSYDLARRKEVSVISLALDTLLAQPNKIVELKVEVLLGDAVQDTLFFSNADTRPLVLHSSIGDSATVRYTGLCVAGGTRLLGQGSALRMLVFPVPSYAQLHVQCQSAERGLHRLYVYDERGALRCFKFWIGAPSLVKQWTFDEFELENGVYSLQLESPTQSVSERAIIRR